MVTAGPPEPIGVIFLFTGNFHPLATGGVADATSASIGGRGYKQNDGPEPPGSHQPFGPGGLMTSTNELDISVEPFVTVREKHARSHSFPTVVARDGDGDGPRPGDGDGPRPGDGDGPRPGDGDGPKPGDGDGPKPGDGDGPKPGDGDGPTQ